MGYAGGARDAFGSSAKGKGDVGVGGVVPSPGGPLVFVDLAVCRKNGIVWVGRGVTLVALGDAAQCFGRAEDGVAGGGMSNGVAFGAVLLVVK